MRWIALNGSIGATRPKLETTDMARARNIKPGFFRNAELVELPFETRLLFQGLWVLADREGRLVDRPKQIKMEIFPADSVDIDVMLNQLSLAGFVVRYEVDGARYIQVVNFCKHQNPHRDERASTIPAQFATVQHSANNEESQQTDEGASYVIDAGTVQAPCDVDASTVGIGLIPDSLIPDSLTKPLVIGDDREVAAKPAGRESISAKPGFAEFWMAYPKKRAKGDAEKSWRRIKPDAGLVAKILEAVEVAKASDDWRKDGGQFIPYPASWLNGKCWEDGPAPAAAYNADVLGVMESYNAILGEIGYPAVAIDVYSSSRAVAVAEFLTLSKKPDWVKRYFTILGELKGAKPGFGFDWAIRTETFLRVKEGNFAVAGAA